ncbi:MAG: UDP-N-acetylglucosamine--N-acetylmuramyl-(pentapeptide) pyrophosphoryl-undecaprenol N-acetylglucosamine transferase [Curvibacter sp. RIFCSPHIGHO2_12_FULL_63_18]|uniref:UDP-N-acetylglucosamine--N-acetylmuramyl- (pentapeptide) pyrophosphoryl-undecaprenol N-acetylglucosamine transferase n=1 Tax=Rhodoferax sp. TaxID=50421 RepID=UPI0008AB619E|nr:UDP-N-acetylglucosamine--N-acetylmuramyl-(pentapeptide) pyrophosphoryl-undecaprenol N-acetylglucosamine transferase [Rhodoferax sp.]OGO97914.1 MAG: UDP-N-acetylglucosamine--N-acetylmuramyl-(pentapeptide) pyrophosphoryl-undecaprenol N-acetylglucosamine transferase [Curvibacter sp. GWA2_63_95]OGO99355.1 MAG: UDP-N-acetylglucosamine--N-acetylmuramyl-(pentapeptide) pyrophosphoryl-undecaprenol N-acetylglucosamine transferase [Curvibacter sp. RIFCSPHIGHO2_12_FULL_63_18]HCX81067.1 UDP-N-acetylglucos
MSQKTALIMAGGTGGHIFPGLAVAQALLDKGWRVHWLGAPGSMESRIVPARGIPLELVDFGGVRGKGLRTLALLPFKLLRAFWQSLQVVRRVKPDVLVGLGGYITFPGGMMGVLCGKPLVLHEQNSVAGMANKVLAGVADRVFAAFPNVLKKGEWVGNPLRTEFLNLPAPDARFAGRSGPLKVLVVGGSLGARALNTVVPQALALIPEAQRPVVTHQAGEKQIDALRANYAAAGIAVHMSVAGPFQDAKAPVRSDPVGSGGSAVREATSAGVTITPFIDNTAQAFADADLVICRAGASTVTEIAAVGAAAVFVPFPAAVDDHQTFNARFLVDQGGGWLLPQADMTPAVLAEMLQKTERFALIQRGLEAKKMQKLNATEAVVAACEELAR